MDLKQLEKEKLQRDFILNKCTGITDASQMTKHHFIRAQIRHKQSLTSQIVDDNGLVHNTQEQMSKVTSNYWANIMKTKNINKLNLEKVLRSIDKKLPQSSVEQLSQSSSEFISTEKN